MYLLNDVSYFMFVGIAFRERPVVVKRVVFRLNWRGNNGFSPGFGSK